MNEKENQIMLMAAIIAANKSGCYKELIAADAIALSKEIYKQVMGKKSKLLFISLSTKINMRICLLIFGSRTKYF
jgi:hypothetical protein